MTEIEALALIRVGGKPQEVGVKFLFGLYRKPLLGFFMRSGISLEDSEEVLQETFIKIVKNIDKFTGVGQSDNPAKAWVWEIARNCLHDLQRKLFTKKDREAAVDDEILEQIAAPAENSRISLQDCIGSGLQIFQEKMPDRYLVLELQMNGESIEAISSVINRTAAATKMYLYECRKKLAPFIFHCRDLAKD